MEHRATKLGYFNFSLCYPKGNTPRNNWFFILLPQEGNVDKVDKDDEVNKVDEVDEVDKDDKDKENKDRVYKVDRTEQKKVM